jgi:hypothetical protein
MRIQWAIVAVLSSLAATACVPPQRALRATPMMIPAHVHRLTIASPDTAAAERTHWYAGPVGLHIGSPAGPSLGLGVLRSVSCTPEPTCADRETIAMGLAEPGLNAGRASVGIAGVIGGLGTAWTARATLLQRWRTSTDRYAGLELSLHPLLFSGARVGAFRPLQDEKRSVLWTLDVSFGL